MTFNKKAVACAVSTALGGVSAVQAADIQFMTITDVDGDGTAGAFAFAAPGSTSYTNFYDDSSSISFTPLFGSEVIISPTTAGVGITADGNDQGSATFTAGFLFSGGPFLPNSLNATGTGSNSTPGAGGIDGNVSSSDTTLTMTEFNWAGNFGTSLFPLDPTGGEFTSNLAWQTTGDANCETGSTNVCYQLQWEHFIAPQGGFSGDTIWQLEGVAKLDGAVTLAGLPAVPVPAAAWLFGSGLLGLVGVARRRNNK